LRLCLHVSSVKKFSWETGVCQTKTICHWSKYRPNVFSFLMIWQKLPFSIRLFAEKLGFYFGVVPYKTIFFTLLMCLFALQHPRSDCLENQIWYYLLFLQFLTIKEKYACSTFPRHSISYKGCPWWLVSQKHSFLWFLSTSAKNAHIFHAFAKNKIVWERELFTQRFLLIGKMGWWCVQIG